jgi:hypothetical protein
MRREISRFENCNYRICGEDLSISNRKAGRDGHLIGIGDVAESRWLALFVFLRPFNKLALWSRLGSNLMVLHDQTRAEGIVQLDALSGRAAS